MQKAVLGRVLVYQVLDLHRVQMEAAGYGLLCEAIRNTLQLSTARQVEFCPSGPLSSYLHQLAEELRSAMLPFPDVQAKRMCASLLDDIDRVLAQADQPPRDLLTAAFDKAVRETSGLYQAHGLPVTAEMMEHVRVTFDHQLGPVTSALPIELTATTYFDDAPGGPPSAHVDVVINAKSMDEQTAFALPYVLLHECICHVFQGPWQGGRVQADAGSRFAEGWMDYVAFSVHQGLSDTWRPDLPEPNLMVTPRADAQREAAESVHKARYAKNEQDRAWAQRALGVHAAHNMMAVLARMPAARTDPFGAFVRMSLQLNASPIDNQRRDLFVTRVYQATLHAIRPALIPLVQHYLSCGDVERLVEEVLKTFT